MVTDQFHYGAIINLDCTPNAGHEQGGRRPGIIVSNDIFNQTNNMRWVCPITHTEKKSPYYIPVNGCKKTDGYVICDQPRSFDLSARHARFVEDAPQELIAAISELVKDCL